MSRVRGGLPYGKCAQCSLSSVRGGVPYDEWAEWYEEWVDGARFLGFNMYSLGHASLSCGHECISAERARTVNCVPHEDVDVRLMASFPATPLRSVEQSKCAQWSGLSERTHLAHLSSLQPRQDQGGQRVQSCKTSLS